MNVDDSETKIQEYHFHYENIRPIWDQLVPNHKDDGTGTNIQDIIDIVGIEKKVDQ